MNIDISIIIPVKNGIAGGIEKCLAGIFSQKTDYSYEVIAIDSGSADGTPYVIKKYPGIKLMHIRPEKFGHGRTRNLGARSAQGKYLVYINQDAWPANESWLENMIDGFKDEDNIAAVYGRLIPKEGCHLFMRRDIEGSMGDKREIIAEQEKAKETTFSTISVAVKKAVWEKIAFDDEIDIAEDKDWARKVLKCGYKISYEPSSAVYHSHDYNFGQMFVYKFRAEKVLRHIFNGKKRPVLGLFLALGGFTVKFASDIFYIIGQKIGIMEKFAEIGISFSARLASFSGRYLGGIS